MNVLIGLTFYFTMTKLKTLTAVAVVGLICSCQTYYEKHNMLNNKQPCPEGTQADQYGMECKPIVKEVIPENETKLQKFNRFLGKVDDGIKNNEVLNKNEEFHCKPLDYACLQRENEYYGRPSRAGF